MDWIDWAAVLIPLAPLIWVTWKAQRYVRSVADFMTAGRAAGRYVVCNAVGEVSMGVIGIVAVIQMWYKAGFTIGWWQQLLVPTSTLIALSGFVIYRYRESRCMTLAQFFEARYSKRFRLFMGIMAWISGVLNYALFPIVGARFFVYYCGFPRHVLLAGMPIRTEALVMFVLLSAALTFALAGGQLTAMVTDCVAGLITGIMFMAVIVTLLWVISWTDIRSAMAERLPTESLLNPFDTGQVKDFNVWYVLITVIGTIYSTMAWQGGHAFKSSAVSAHEAKMGNVLGSWRNYAKGVLIVIPAVCAYTYLHHPHYAAGAAWVNEALAKINNSQDADQMRVPLVLAHLLPVGIKGSFAAIMLFGLLSCDASYLHSWGSVFAQDVLLPFRKKRLSTTQHLRLIRWSITFVAVFAYCYGLWFPQTDYILMYFALTGAIFLGGAGSAIIGGFYWKKGTTAAAYAGMITGSSLAVVGIIVRQIDPAFVLNGQWISLFAMISAVAVYIAVSLLTCREEFDLDRILRRGRWAIDREDNSRRTVPAPSRYWKSLLGIDEQFTVADKCQSIGLFTWTMLWFAVFVVGTIWNLVEPWPVSWWANYWYVAGIIMPLALGTFTTIWFTVGGLRDLRLLYRRLRTMRRDEQDDGSVATLVQQERTPADTRQE